MSGLGWRALHLLPEAGVHAGTTTRVGGVSVGPCAGLNLGERTGDEPAAVAENRRRLREALSLPDEPLWLTQVHGTDVYVDDGLGRPIVSADAAVTVHPGRVLAVLTADCLPVVFASLDGQRIGVAHAGWRGLAAGVLEATVAHLGVPGDEVVAALGPCIGPEAFEVGAEVREAFVGAHAEAAVAFAPNAGGRWQADLVMLARQRLTRLGVRSIGGGVPCTYADEATLYSYRRDPRTGRMATLVWREA
jgi:polyphenol oxidase